MLATHRFRCNTPCMPRGDLLTVPEAADFYRTSRQSIYRWVKEGKLTAYRTPGGTMRLRRGDVEEMLARVDPTEAAS